MKKVWLIGANSDVAKELMIRMNGKYELVAASRNRNELKRFVNKEKITKIRTAKLDVCKKNDLDGFLQSYTLPDIIIFAQGILKTGDHVLDVMEEMIQCNYAACIYMIENVWKDMVIRRSGCIVGITSVAADRGKMSNKLYSSTKAAFSSYLQALMQEGDKNDIQVIDIKPGYIRSKMIKDDKKAYTSVLAEKPSKTAALILRKIEGGRSGTIYIKKIWRMIMCIIKMIPERLYIRMRI